MSKRKQRRAWDRRRSQKHISPQKNRKLLLLISGVVVAAIIALVPIILMNPFKQGDSGNVDESLELVAELTVDRLVVTHPEREIREDLDQLLLSGKIFYIIMDSPSGTSRKEAVFGLIPPKDLELTGGNTVKGEGLVPFFAFERRFLLSSISDIAKQGLIYHEYQHFLQWEAGMFPQHLLVAGAKINTGDEIEIVYKMEVEAYTKQCTFLAEFNATHEATMCSGFQRGDLLAFRRTIARTLLGDGDYQEFAPLLMRLAETSNGR